MFGANGGAVKLQLALSTVRCLRCVEDSNKTVKLTALQGKLCDPTFLPEPPSGFLLPVSGPVVHLDALGGLQFCEM